MKMKAIAVLIFVSLLTSGIAHAQYGLDGVANEMKEKGLFTPHANNCGTGEVFMAIGSGGTSGATGFCVESTERTTALDWISARQTCAAAGKRLMEPAEFKYACDNATSLGLSGMSDNYEWATNFAFFVIDYWYGQGMQKLNAIKAGNGSCNSSASGPISDITSGTPDTATFRCIR